MSIPLVVNGTTFDFPVTQDVDWGPVVTAWASAVTNGMLQKAGGAFTLLAEVDFGPTYGLKSQYYKSRSTNVASSGQIRFARTDVLSWRNETNDGNLDLSVNSSNQLLFDGDLVGSIDTVSDTSTIDLTLLDGDLSADVVDGSITNDQVSASAAIAFSKLATLTSANILVGSAGNVATSVALSGEALISNVGAITLDNASVIGKVITGYVSGAGTVAATDTILQAIQKLNGNIALAVPALNNGLIFVGNASNVAVGVAMTGDIAINNTGVTSYSGTVPINKGGTGQTSASAGFNALSPITNTGDIIYSSSGTTNTRLGIGSAGQVLGVASGIPAWVSVPGASAIRSVTTTDTASAVTDTTLVLSGASFTQTLPAPATGKIYRIIHGGTSLSQVYTIATTAGATIGGVASGSYALYTNGESLEIQFDGSNFRILDHKTKTGVVSAGALTIGATTTAPTKGTVSQDAVTWERDGRFAIYQWQFAQTSAGGAAGSGDYKGVMPTNMTIDTTNITPYTTVATTNAAGLPPSYVESGGILYTSSQIRPRISVYDSTNFRLALDNLFASVTFWGSGNSALNANFNISLTAKIPITGWQP